MAVTPEILATYWAPRQVFRRQLARQNDEGRALAYLMVACLLIFVAQWPRLARQAGQNPDVPLEALLGAALLGWAFMAPLFFYLLAGLAHLLARALGGHGSVYGARLALFWTLLATAPLWLAHGVLAGVLPPGLPLSLAGLGLLVAVALIWLATMIEAQRENVVEFDEGVT